jgi:hypothetical protein
VTEAETWETINKLINRAGEQLEVKIDHPSGLGTERWSNWTWEDEHYGDKRIITFKHWKDQYSFDKEVMTIRYPPVLSEEEQAEFVKLALEKIELLKNRPAN